ncbi:hypothetical protein HanPSC8_Chr01g0011101 [Helianthus annuus]|nr:hypothetical protein HanHA89_Chr01g0010121 [Helianthus annuus]KAJ0782513.1 hypothetical protein HanLR1_Chr01g0009071 [Helianthus annuus]KAJ0956134.1 hypothetical protein HanPSC8_Chr01g0011101 [Helianthus annuus]
MGQTIGKEEKDDLGPTIGKCYDKHFSDRNKEWNSAEFYHAVCEIVEEMNTMLGSTQFHVPKTSTLEQAYNKHHKGKEKSLSKEEFQRIMQDIILDSGITGMGIKDILLFIFGIPIVTTFVKQRAGATAIPNDIFIPAVTSASVFLLTKLNKI